MKTFSLILPADRPERATSIQPNGKRSDALGMWKGVNPSPCKGKSLMAGDAFAFSRRMLGTIFTVPKALPLG